MRLSFKLCLSILLVVFLSNTIYAIPVNCETQDIQALNYEDETSDVLDYLQETFRKSKLSR